MTVSGRDATTHSAVLTSRGRGAVAVVVVWGPRATEVLRSRFLAASVGWERRPAESLCLGRWGGPEGEEVLVRRKHEHEVEVHCHGGNAAVEALLASLADAGAPPAAAQAWREIRVADPIRRAAEADLSQAPTERTAAILLDQLRGALGEELARLVLRLRQTPDDAQLPTALEELAETASFGLHLVAKRPWRVVLAGPPNVGKSSLLNALAGFSRAIVWDLPGTTRDVVELAAAIDGWPVQLVDMAGLRDGQDPLEVAGIQRAYQQLEKADVVIAVRAAAAPVPENLRNHRTQATWLRVVNKCDLESEPEREPEELRTSALTGRGVGDLWSAIRRAIVPRDPPAGSPVLFRAAHEAAVRAAQAALAAGDALAAARMLEDLSANPSDC